MLLISSNHILVTNVYMCNYNILRMNPYQSYSGFHSNNSTFHYLHEWPMFFGKGKLDLGDICQL